MADTLRNEFLLYGITIHCYFPATIFTPGFEEESKTKPLLTKNIEGPDEGQTPEQCASKLVRGIAVTIEHFLSLAKKVYYGSGLERGHFFITSDAIGHIFRNAAKGLSPTSTFFGDLFWRIVSMVCTFALLPPPSNVLIPQADRRTSMAKDSR